MFQSVVQCSVKLVSRIEHATLCTDDYNLIDLITLHFRVKHIMQLCYFFLKDVEALQVGNLWPLTVMHAVK